MTNKSEEYNSENLVFERDKAFIGGRQFRQVFSEESVPAFEIKTKQHSIETFIEIESTRIMVEANSFRGEIEIKIEKYVWSEEDDNWEDACTSTYSITEIQAILCLLENIANYYKISPKTVK